MTCPTLRYYVEKVIEYGLTFCEIFYDIINTVKNKNLYWFRQNFNVAEGTEKSSLQFVKPQIFISQLILYL